MDHEFSAFGHRFDGVLYKVDQGSLESRAIESDIREVSIEEFADVDILFVGLSLKQVQDGLDLVIERADAHFEFLHFCEAQEISQEVFHAVAVLFDHFHFSDDAAFAGPLALFDFFGEKFGVHVDHREWVFDFMSERTGEFCELVVLTAHLLFGLLIR